MAKNTTDSTKSTLNYTLGGRSPEFYISYIDFLLELASFFVASPDDLRNKSGLWDCEWAQKQLERNATNFREKICSKLFSQKQKTDRDNDFSMVLRACLNLADDIIISEVMLHEYQERFLKPLQELQDQLDSVKDRMETLQQSSNAGDQTPLGRTMQTFPDFFSHYNNFIQWKRNKYERNMEKIKECLDSFWQLALQNSRDSDTIWQEIMASFHTQAQDLAQFKHTIYALCDKYHDAWSAGRYPKKSNSSNSGNSDNVWWKLENEIHTLREYCREEPKEIEKKQKEYSIAAALIIDLVDACSAAQDSHKNPSATNV